MRMYLTQTFFDDDEDFEFIQSDRTVIPITVKTQDYINEHSENSTEEVGENQSASDENEWWRDYGRNGVRHHCALFGGIQAINLMLLLRL